MDVLQAAAGRGQTVPIVRDPREAVAEAEVVVTDTWTSMGQAQNAAKIAEMEPYRVDQAMMAAAADGAVFLHCLPAHRGEEVVDAVMDGPQSAVWDEAENRLHAQKSLLLWCLGKL
jgi:ornithine carbamoyltransferase